MYNLYYLLSVSFQPTILVNYLQSLYSESLLFSFLPVQCDLETYERFHPAGGRKGHGTTGRQIDSDKRDWQKYYFLMCPRISKEI